MITWLLRTETSRGGIHPTNNKVAATEIVKSNALGQPGNAQDTSILATSSSCSFFFSKKLWGFFFAFLHSCIWINLLVPISISSAGCAAYITGTLRLNPECTIRKETELAGIWGSAKKDDYTKLKINAKPTTLRISAFWMSKKSDYFATSHATLHAEHAGQHAKEPTSSCHEIWRHLSRLQGVI